MVEVEDNADRSGAADRPAAGLEVIGCGNPFAGDDGAGAEIVRRLQARGDCGARLRMSWTAGVELLDIFSEADAVLFVDAVSSGEPPGTLHLVPLPWAGLQPRGLAAFSSHGWGLLETLQLARALRRRIPRLALLGVEIGSLGPGERRSPAVERAVGLAVERFSRLAALLSRQAASQWQRPRQFAPDDNSFPGDEQCA